MAVFFMVTRRDFFKGGGIAATGIALASIASCSATSAVDESLAGSKVAVTGVDRFRRGGAGPLYWSTYGYNIKAQFKETQGSGVRDEGLGIVGRPCTFDFVKQ